MWGPQDYNDQPGFRSPCWICLGFHRPVYSIQPQDQPQKHLGTALPCPCPDGFGIAQNCFSFSKVCLWLLKTINVMPWNAAQSNVSYESYVICLMCHIVPWYGYRMIQRYRLISKSAHWVLHEYFAFIAAVATPPVPIGSNRCPSKRYKKWNWPLYPLWSSKKEKPSS